VPQSPVPPVHVENVACCAFTRFVKTAVIKKIDRQSVITIRFIISSSLPYDLWFFDSIVSTSKRKK
jgi:hypothetical protein